MKLALSLRLAAVASAVVFLTCSLIGCGSQPGSSSAPTGSSTTTPAPTQPAATSPADDEHAHKAGAHGGVIVSIGADSYHAEAVVEKSGTLRLFLLGRDESRIQEVESQTLNAYVKVAGDSEAVPMEIKPAPQEGDAEGKTSQFTGELPASVVGKPIDVTIPNLRIGDERFRVGFTTATLADSHGDEMPSAVPKDEEEALYLTPGGKYTAADIEANGRTTASSKFRGVPSRHDAKTRPGDRLCPISTTKANPKFTWIIGGQAYQFCCPPCVDEFVRLAKESPDEIKNPSEYVKQ